MRAGNPPLSVTVVPSSRQTQEQAKWVPQGQEVVLVSWGCCNKLPGTQWCKTTERILSWLWRPEVQNQGVSRLWFLLEALGESRFPASLLAWQSLAFLGLWLHHSDLCLCLPITFLSFCLCILSSSYKTPVIRFRAQHKPRMVSSPGL